MLYTPPSLSPAAPPTTLGPELPHRPHPCLLGPGTSGLSGINRGRYPPVPGDMQCVGPNPRDRPQFSLYNFCTNTGKRHGRSSGMRHGWRSSWSGVRTPVRLSVQGPVGEAPATAPFSIPLHHWYRRCVGWRVSSIFFLPPTPAPGPLAHTKTRHQARHTCSSAPRHCYRRPPGGACPPHSPLPLACGRGLKLGSSGQQPAAQPLHHAAQTPARLRPLHPSCLLCPECFSVCVWLGGGTQHTINLGEGDSGTRAPPRAVFVVCCAVQD